MVCGPATDRLVQLCDGWCGGIGAGVFGAGEAVKVLQGAHLMPAASEDRAVRSAVVSHCSRSGRGGVRELGADDVGHDTEERVGLVS